MTLKCLCAAALSFALVATSAFAGVSSPPYKEISDAPAQTSRIQLSASALVSARAFNNGAVAFTNAGSPFVERWANLTNWTGSSGTAMQVSGGNLYSNGQGGSSGMNHLWQVPASGYGFAQFEVTVVAGGASGGVIIGVDSTAPSGGAAVAPTSAAGSMFGISFGGATSTPKCYLNGTGTNVTAPSGITTQAGTYLVTIAVDPTYVSVVATLEGGYSAINGEIRCQQLRSGFTVNNLYVFDSDSRLLTGSYVQPGAASIAKNSFASLAPNAPFGNNFAVQWTGDGANRFKIETPPTYDGRSPMPWAMFFHGSGADENYFSDNGNIINIRNALLNAGYIVITAYGTTATAWGANSDLDAYYKAYQYAKEHYALGTGVLVLNSMGGITGLDLLAGGVSGLPAGRVPGIVGVICDSCTYSLADNYINPNGLGFNALINTSYGITASTLAASASAGATTVSSNTSYAANTVIALSAVQGYGVAEFAKVQSVSGSGPYTLTLASPLQNAHNSGDSISDFGTKTAGHDPANLPCSAFRGIPFAIYTATDDTSVNPTNNGFRLGQCLQGNSAFVFVQPGITGGHSWTINGYQTGDPTYAPGSLTGNNTGLGAATGQPTLTFLSMMDFLNRYTGN